MPCVPGAESWAPRQRRDATSSAPPDHVTRAAAMPSADEKGIDVATSSGYVSAPEYWRRSGAVCRVDEDLVGVVVRGGSIVVVVVVVVVAAGDVVVVGEIDAGGSVVPEFES